MESIQIKHIKTYVNLGTWDVQYEWDYEYVINKINQLSMSNHLALYLKPSKTGPKRTKLTRLKLRSPGGLSSICPSTMAENAKPSLAAKLAKNRDLNAENDLAIFGH